MANLTSPPSNPEHNGFKAAPFSVKPSGRNIDHKRNNFCTLAWQKGIPQELMDGLSTDGLEKLVNWWPKQKFEKSDTLPGKK